MELNLGSKPRKGDEKVVEGKYHGFEWVKRPNDSPKSVPYYLLAWQNAENFEVGSVMMVYELPFKTDKPKF